LDDRKLIAAQASDGIDLADTGEQPVGDCTKELVADRSIALTRLGQMPVYFPPAGFLDT
jgi:hypothetical protein